MQPKARRPKHLHYRYENWEEGDGCDDINECDFTDCGSDTYCSNFGGSFECRCKSGFENLTAAGCVDIEECNWDYRHDVCTEIEFTVCVNTHGSHDCPCAPGYKGDKDDKCCDETTTRRLPKSYFRFVNNLFVYSRILSHGMAVRPEAP